jgi:ribose-phosphate pyrophosphokinase
MRTTRLKLFALNSAKEFGELVSSKLAVPLSRHKETCFHDGECYVASEENVRNKDVYVIQSIYTDDQESVNDKLMKLLIFIGSLKDASARRITAVIPYMPYSRQDRKTSSRAPITTKYISHIFESVFTERILTIDAHNPGAYQNAFEAHFDNLEAGGLFAKCAKLKFASKFGDDLVVMSPDEGGLKRARKFRTHLEKALDEKIGLCVMDKTHEGEEIKGHGLMELEDTGKVAGRRVLIVDDMISSGKTILECIETVKDHRAACVEAVFATHGLFVGKANEYLDSDFLHNIVVTDTIKPFRVTNPNVLEKVTIIQTHELFAEAIKRTHKGESISDLIERNGVSLTYKKLHTDALLC